MWHLRRREIAPRSRYRTRNCTRTNAERGFDRVVQVLRAQDSLSLERRGRFRLSDLPTRTSLRVCTSRTTETYSLLSRLLVGQLRCECRSNTARVWADVNSGWIFVPTPDPKRIAVVGLEFPASARSPGPRLPARESFRSLKSLHRNAFTTAAKKSSSISMRAPRSGFGRALRTTITTLSRGLI